MPFFQDIIRLTPFFVTLFWGIVFVLHPAKKNRARFALGFFMLTTAVVYGSHAIFFSHDYSLYLKIDGLYMLTDLSVYPLYYLYIRLLTKDIKFQKLFLWHLLPAVIISVLFELLFFHTTPAAREIYIREVLLQNHWPSEASQNMLQPVALVYFTSRIIFGIQSILYLLLSLSLIREYNYRVANFYSDLKDRKLVWLELLTLTLIIAAISSFFINILGRHFFEQRSLVLIPSFLFSTLLFIIGLLGNKQNQTITDIVMDENKEETDYEESGNTLLLKEKLQRLIQEEMPYLNPQLRITDLSSKLYTNRTYLSNLINSEFKVSFSDFVNQYRIQYAKKLMDDDSQSRYSLEYFSEKAGFGSLSTFLRAFKQKEGITAGTYRQRVIKKAS